MQAKRCDLVTRAAIAAVDIYRNIISPSMLHSCRFFPSCSAYARESLERHGLFQGAWRALRRILRCHPLSQGGADPVK